MMQGNLGPPRTLPEWLPDAVRIYLDHTAEGLSMRALARRGGCHASTVMRTVRRYEKRREDPLLDEALDALSRAADSPNTPMMKEQFDMTCAIRPGQSTVDALTLKREGLRILRRLMEPGSCLAIATDMEKAIVLRGLPDGRSARLAVLDRAVAQAFVLQDWIVCRKAGRVSNYDISAAGKAALKRFQAEEDAGRMAAGFAEAPLAFADQRRLTGEDTADPNDAPYRPRPALSESPIAVLGRRREKDGTPFLEPGLVEVAERLREDFELSHMGARVTQNWERFLSGNDRTTGPAAQDGPLGALRARERVAAALRELGPGLGDVALRVCCYLEGIEATEQRMGWAARSGKIVLRIALQRLRRHYDQTYGKHGPLIG
jgi:lambda repressor-like predicted transcriptional regulator